MDSADNQGAAEQGGLVGQNMYWGCRPQLHRGSSYQRQPREDSNEEDKENQETRPKVSSHLNVITSITEAEAQRTLNHRWQRDKGS